jgi:O-antigen ligase
MGKVLFISLIFSLGFFYSPVYAVVLGFVPFTFVSSSRIPVFNEHKFVIIYVITLSLFYFQLTETEVVKEILQFIIGPFLFYFLGKSDLSILKNYNKLFLLLFFSLAFFSLYTFFKDTSGGFSLDLNQNYYYNSRNSLIIKRDLVFVFMNETNLSLLILTCVFFSFVLFEKQYLKLFFSLFFISILLILASRTAISGLIIILLFNYWKFNSLKSKFFKFIFFSILSFILVANVNVFEIPYISTFVNRLVELSFSNDSEAYGLDGRFIHYAHAIENTSFFDVKGYKNLLNTYEFSSHNEVLGHSSAVGVLLTISFFVILFSVIKKAYKNLAVKQNKTLYSLLSYMIISYIFIGLTENIFLTNTIWFYLFMYTIGVSTIKNKYA